MEDFEAFIRQVQERLSAGQREYGDVSFSRDPTDLLNEIQEELMDICGWGYILHSRLARVQRALDTLRKEQKNDG